jgi:NAD(P)-dependent dehydrogenase (short-subunit alcohol dehydrogenase family)
MKTSNACQVNFISHVLLTQILLPSLARASEPRITCTTSCMQYFGIFDLENANSGKNSYPNNKLYFQTWLTELQARMIKNEKYKHIVVHGVHPGYVKTNIWASPEDAKSMSWIEWGLGKMLHYVGIDSQQGSLTITHAATAVEWGSRHLASKTDDAEFGGGGRYFNRIWDAKPMPQTRHPECRRQVWEFVSKELELRQKGLLAELGE